MRLDRSRVITLNDDAALIDDAKPIVNELRANMVRVDADFSATPIKAKIAEAEKARVQTLLVIGGRDVDAGNVSVRLHSKGPQGAKPKGEVVAEILTAIKESTDVIVAPASDFSMARRSTPNADYGLNRR